MRRRSSLHRVVVLVVLAFAAAAAVTFLASPPAESNATGCVLHTNSIPIWDAACSPEPGFSCYLCDYTVDGETTSCSENKDGSVQFCINEEQQDTPPF